MANKLSKQDAQVMHYIQGRANALKELIEHHTNSAHALSLVDQAVNEVRFRLELASQK